MAKIIKKKDENNQTQSFLEAEEVISKKVLWKNMIIKFILLSFFSGGIYYYYRTINYNNSLIYLGGFLIISLLIILLPFGTKLSSYQSYNQDDGHKIDKLDHKFEEKVLEILNKDSYKLLNNIYLPCSDKYLQQIDSIIIGSGNIYLLEIRKWTGLIEGMVKSDYWKNEKEEEIQNPYLQNKIHVKNVEEVIYDDFADEEIKVYNLVVNLEMNSSFNLPDKDNYPVFDNFYDSLYWIKKIEQKTDRKISEVQQQEIIKSLLRYHFSALHEAELNLNQELLKKYGLYQEFSQGLYRRQLVNSAE